jgi:hypothetical protein
MLDGNCDGARDSYRLAVKAKPLRLQTQLKVRYVRSAAREPAFVRSWSAHVER